MTDYYNGKLTDIMPDNIKGDPAVQAISYAISGMVKRIVDRAEKTGIYAVIDRLDEEILDLLAVELRTKYYAEWLSVEEKRTMIKKTLIWYYRAGTLYTVKELIDFVFQSARPEEWFEYGGGAYLFRIIVDVISQDISMEKYFKFLKSIYEVKNTRSHLEKIIFQCDKYTEVKNVAAGAIGQEITIEPIVARKIGIENEDKAMAAMFFEQDMNIEASDEMTEKDVYVRNPGITRVVTGNGSVVRIG